MNKFLIIIVILFSSSVFAQEKKILKETETIYHYSVIPEKPEFIQGGMGGLIQFVNTNIKYPENARKNKIEEVIFIQFIIEKDGSVSNAEVKRGNNPDLKKEALRVIMSMPKWKPGKFKNSAKRVYYVFPVKFNLNNFENKATLDIVEFDKNENPIIENKATLDIVEFDKNKNPIIKKDTSSNPIIAVKRPKGYKKSKTKYYNYNSHYLKIKPVFYGGEEALQKYLKEKLIYPELSRKEKIEEKLVVFFSISKEGKISNIMVRPPYKSEENAKEAKRLIGSMPDWKPGIYNGEPVNVNHSLIIEFKID